MEKSFTIRDIRDGLTKGHFTAEEIFKKYSDKIKKENKKLNSYLSIFDSGVARVGTPVAWRSSKTEPVRGDEGQAPAMDLYGVPCAIKDNMLIDSTICTAGSKILENYTSSY